MLPSDEPVLQGLPEIYDAELHCFCGPRDREKVKRVRFFYGENLITMAKSLFSGTDPG